MCTHFSVPQAPAISKLENKLLLLEGHFRQSNSSRNRLDESVKFRVEDSEVLLYVFSDTCTFDKMGDTCGFHNVDGDDFDWTQRLGSTYTPSGNLTGPAADHTTGRWGNMIHLL